MPATATAPAPVAPSPTPRVTAAAAPPEKTSPGVVSPDRELVELKRRYAAFLSDLQPSGEVGQAIVQRMATLSLRMERGVAQEMAALAGNVRRAEAEFVAPEGVDLAEGRPAPQGGRPGRAVRPLPPKPGWPAATNSPPNGASSGP